MSPLDSPHSPSPHPKLGRLLVVDDEVELMTALCQMLTEYGYEAAGFTSGKDALEALKEQDFDLLLADLMMPEMDGITLLRLGLEIDPNLVGIIMTGQGTVQTAVEAMKIGAFDYVLKPFKLQAVLPTLLPLVQFAIADCGLTIGVPIANRQSQIANQVLGPSNGSTTTLEIAAGVFCSDCPPSSPQSLPLPSSCAAAGACTAL